ncbi:hypothetical protein FQZ97_761750 [compost metagenome]
MRSPVRVSSAALMVATPFTSTRFSASRNVCRRSSASFSLVRSSPRRLFIQLAAVMDISMLASSWLSMNPLAIALAATAAMRGSDMSTCTLTSWLLPCGTTLMRSMKSLVTESRICASVGSPSFSRSSGSVTGTTLLKSWRDSRPRRSIRGSGCCRGSNSGSVVRFS